MKKFWDEHDYFEFQRMKTGFKKDLLLGQAKEQAVLNVLEMRYNIYSIIDNSYNTHDIILDNGLKIEVKADERIHETNNLLLELQSDYKTKKPGWLQYSECDILAVCVDRKDEFRYTDSIIFIDFKALSKYIKLKFFNGDFNCDDDISLKKVRSINGKALNILVPDKEFRKFIICIFSKVENKEVYRRGSLEDFCDSSKSTSV